MKQLNIKSQKVRLKSVCYRIYLEQRHLFDTVDDRTKEKKMRFILLICNIAVFFTVISATFFNPYPKYELFSDGEDPGDALYLTDYIENGEIEKVCLIF